MIAQIKKKTEVEHANIQNKQWKVVVTFKKNEAIKIKYTTRNEQEK